MATAFESITTRKSWYAGEALPKYTAVMYSTNGKLVMADGTGPFAGIVEYGADAADDMVTVVDGAYPAIASAAITVGSKVRPDANNPGKFKIAAAAGDVYGIALTAAGAANELFTIATLPVSTTV